MRGNYAPRRWWRGVWATPDAAKTEVRLQEERTCVGVPRAFGADETPADSRRHTIGIYRYNKTAFKYLESDINVRLLEINKNYTIIMNMKTSLNSKRSVMLYGYY